MKAEKTAIRILAATALLLILAIVFIPTPATGQNVSLKEGDYLVATRKLTTGGDGIYVIDTRLGVVGLFAYDPASRTVVLRTMRPLGDAFGGR